MGVIYDIFEGTAEIQRLVISRAISGMQISYQDRSGASSSGPPASRTRLPHPPREGTAEPAWLNIS